VINWPGKGVLNDLIKRQLGHQQPRFTETVDRVKQARCTKHFALSTSHTEVGTTARRVDS